MPHGVFTVDGVGVKDRVLASQVGRLSRPNASEPLWPGRYVYLSPSACFGDTVVVAPVSRPFSSSGMHPAKHSSMRDKLSGISPKRALPSNVTKR